MSQQTVFNARNYTVDVENDITYNPEGAGIGAADFFGLVPTDDDELDGLIDEWHAEREQARQFDLGYRVSEEDIILILEGEPTTEHEITEQTWQRVHSLWNEVPPEETGYRTPMANWKKIDYHRAAQWIQKQINK